MKGRDVAANLRANVNRWTQYLYYKEGHGTEPQYCVIGLKLMEMGVKVENLAIQEEMLSLVVDRYELGMDYEDVRTLVMLQQLNDGARSANELASLLETTHNDVDFPLEKLAEAFKAKGGR